MPEEESSGIKLKIFLGALVFFLTLLIGVYAYNYITINKSYISEESDSSTNCLYLNFDVLSADYEAETLTLLIKNPSTSSKELKSITVNTGNQTINKAAIIPLTIEKELVFENLKLSDDIIKVYPENCETFAKNVRVEMK